jgi:hypothetical protein
MRGAAPAKGFLVSGGRWPKKENGHHGSTSEVFWRDGIENRYDGRMGTMRASPTLEIAGQ